MVNRHAQPSAELDLELPPPPSPAAAALGDLMEGMSKSWMWSAMAMQDIRLRYRGSVLGPFWLTISTVIMVAAIGLIYARLFNMDVGRYLPFLTIGLVIWQFVSSLIIEGCQTYMSSQHVISQVRLPFSLHAWRVVYRNLIVLAHNMVIIPPTVASFVQVAFFITPIFWPPESLGHWTPYLPLNPLFAAVDVVRAPLLGAVPLAYSWTVLLVVTLLGCLGTFALFVKFRSRITYWI